MFLTNALLTMPILLEKHSPTSTRLVCSFFFICSNCFYTDEAGDRFLLSVTQNKEGSYYMDHGVFLAGYRCSDCCEIILLLQLTKKCCGLLSLAPALFYVKQKRRKCLNVHTKCDMFDDHSNELEDMSSDCILIFSMKRKASIRSQVDFTLKLRHLNWTAIIQLSYVGSRTLYSSINNCR